MVFIERIHYLFKKDLKGALKKHYFKTKNYQINEFGELFSNGKLIKECCNSNNYVNDRLVNDSGERINIKRHQVVAQIFLKDTMKIGYIVNHKNENKTDNNVTNLEWVSTKYNNHYSRCNCKDNRKLFEEPRTYTEDELEEISSEREIQAIEEVLTKVYQDGRLAQAESMEYLGKYIAGERWV